VPANPWDTAAWPGGSSSGSGSGIAAGLFLGALGTDTGGSIRMPAAYCGISGMKQTYGIVPKSGCYPLGTTLDLIGPMARTAQDCAVMLGVMAGFDASDPSMRPGVGSADYASMLTGDLSGVTIGIDRVHHLTVAGNDPLLADAFEAATAVLGEAGATVVEVTLPYYAELQTATMATLRVEAFAYHHRNLIERFTDYGRYTRPTIMEGALLTAADYAVAQKVRRIAAGALAELFTTVDLVVTPTCGTEALPLEGLSSDGVMSSIFTTYWNSVGNPALSVPMGLGTTGLPLGLQIAGRPLDDGLVLRAGDAYQRLTDFHRRRPPITADLVS
jgi:aspartyl-tRNA(Asn)/glutamyl-tRNA(Gln) amidotransferase subunit A